MRTSTTQNRLEATLLFHTFTAVCKEFDSLFEAELFMDFPWDAFAYGKNSRGANS